MGFTSPPVRGGDFFFCGSEHKKFYLQLENFFVDFIFYNWQKDLTDETEGTFLPAGMGSSVGRAAGS